MENEVRVHRSTYKDKRDGGRAERSLHGHLAAAALLGRPVLDFGPVSHAPSTRHVQP